MFTFNFSLFKRDHSAINSICFFTCTLEYLTQLLQSFPKYANSSDTLEFNERIIEEASFIHANDKFQIYLLIHTALPRFSSHCFYTSNIGIKTRYARNKVHSKQLTLESLIISGSRGRSFTAMAFTACTIYDAVIFSIYI